MERTYAPYPKWFGTAFRRLKRASELTPHLESALRSGTWQEREARLVVAYEIIAEMHNDLGITESLPARSANFFGRPFKVIELTGGFSEAIRAKIEDQEIKRIDLIGSIDQFSDSADLLSSAKWRMKIRKLYE
jgi:hypothetical protein